MRTLRLETTYTCGTPFYNSKLAAGEFLVAFILYTDTLLSINQIAPLLNRAYKTVFEAIKDVEAVFVRGFPTVWDHVGHIIDGPTQVDEMTLVAAYRDVLRVVSVEEGPSITRSWV